MLLPAANVIMQLSMPGVGYGVLESPVDSGNVYKHPFKRARTTGTYLAVATIGTDSDRALIRAAVDTAHRQVRSTASSPVSYNAFDPALQLWVAACLYRYFVDQHEYLHGPLDAAAADAVYLDARRLGTTFRCASRCGRRTGSRSTTTGSGRWKTCESIPRSASICAGWRRWRFCRGRCARSPGHSICSRRRAFCLRSSATMMRLGWSESQQRRFEWLLAALRLADRLIPRQAWILGYRLYLWDMRLRARLGWRVV